MQPSEPQDASIETILARHLPALQAFVRLRTGRAVLARESTADVVQSVCRELLEQRSRFEFRSDAAFRSWLYTTALRKIVAKDRHHRAARRDVGREVPADGSDGDGDRSLLDCYATFATPSRDLAVREQMAQVELAFARLPAEQQEVITFAKIVGLPHAEIASATGRTEEACRQLLRRALIRLTRLIESAG